MPRPRFLLPPAPPEDVFDAWTQPAHLTRWWDPTGTPLNIREEPNGRILGTWQNGVRVRPYEEKKVHGKTWYAVERLADDNTIGWVFDPYLKCEEDEGH